MSVTERLMRQGTWAVKLSELTPRNVLDALEFFGSIVITPQHLPLEVVPAANIVASAVYTGMVRKLERGENLGLGGPGNLAWLGDEKGIGQRLSSFQAASTDFSGWVTGLLGTIDSVASPLTAGTITNIAAPAAGDLGDTYSDVNRRQVLHVVADYYGGEFKVNPNFSLDAGSEADVFVTSPVAVLVRNSFPGFDAQFASASLIDGLLVDDVEDFLTKVIVLGANAEAESTSSTTFTDPQGATVVREWLLTSDTTDTASLGQLATAALDRTKTSLKTIAVSLSIDDFDVQGSFQVGDSIFVNDVRAGLFDITSQIQWRGQTIFPIVLRVRGIKWLIKEGMGVYFRAGDGTLTDLTEYVEFETGSATLEVGADPRALTKNISIGSVVSVLPEHTHQVRAAANFDLLGKLTFNRLDGASQVIGFDGIRLEVGRMDGINATPFIDFHGGDDVDRNARIILLGNQSGLLGGELNIEGASLTLDADGDSGRSIGGNVGTRVGMTGDQAIGAGAFAAVGWDSEVVDDNGWHDNVTNNSRITVDTAGWYIMNAFIQWVGVTANDRLITRIMINGTTEISRDDRQTPQARHTIMSTAIFKLAASDYVTVEVFTGATNSVDASLSKFTVARMF